MARQPQPILNSATLFPVTKEFGLPELLPQAFVLPQVLPPLLRYRAPASVERRARSVCHCFLYDFFFESCWTYPRRTLEHVRQYWGVLTPDYSMYVDWPMAMQLWNCYRSRWVGRWWQEHALRVIPTVNWSTPASYRWCFAGIPPQQVVAVAVPDLRNRVTRVLFAVGYQAMLKALEPRLVLVYGELPFYCSRAVEYPMDVVSMRVAIARRQEV